MRTATDIRAIGQVADLVPTAPEVPNVRWLRPDGEEMGGEDWQNGEARAVAMVLNGPGQRSLLLLFNASAEEVSFVLPGRDGPVRWGVLLDSATGAVAPDWERVDAGADLLVADRSVCVLESEEALP